MRKAFVTFMVVLTAMSGMAFLMSVTAAGAIPTAGRPGFPHDGFRCVSYYVTSGARGAAKCYIDPQYLPADPQSGASWGYTLSTWNARADTLGTLCSSTCGYVPMRTASAGHAATGCTSLANGTHTERFHDAHPTDVPSSGVIQTWGCSVSGGAYTVSDNLNGAAGGTGSGTYTIGKTSFIIGDWWYGGVVANDAALLAAPWPANAFPASGVGNFCENFGVALRSPQVSGTTVLPGAVITISTTSGYLGTVTAGLFNLRYRVDVDSPFVKFGDGSSTIPGPFDLVNYTNHGVTLSAGFEILCDMVSGTDTYWTISGGLSTTATASRACLNLSVVWPKWPAVAGVVVQFAIRLDVGSYTGGVTGIDVVDRTNAASPTTTTISTFRTTDVGGSTSLPMTGGQSMVFDYTPAVQLTQDNVVLICHDAVGVRNFFAGSLGTVLAGKTGVTETIQSRFDACMDALPGMELSSPSTWVKGALGGFICVAEFIFVPTSEYTDALYDSGEAATTKAPISYLAQGATFMYGAFTGAPAAIAAHSSDDFEIFHGMNITNGSTHVVIAAGRIDFADLGSSLTTPRTWLGYGWWLTTVFLFWSMTKRLIRS